MYILREYFLKYFQNLSEQLLFKTLSLYASEFFKELSENLFYIKLQAKHNSY